MSMIFCWFQREYMVMIEMIEPTNGKKNDLSSGSSCILKILK